MIINSNNTDGMTLYDIRKNITDTLYGGDQDQEDEGSSYWHDNEIRIILIIVFFGTMACLLICQFYSCLFDSSRKEGDAIIEDQQRALNDDDENKKPKVRLTKKERIQLYSTAFDTNLHQLTLQKKHIVMKDKETNEFVEVDLGDEVDEFLMDKNDDDDDDDGSIGNDDLEKGNTDDNPYEDLDASIYLSVESDRRLNIGRSNRGIDASGKSKKSLMSKSQSKKLERGISKSLVSVKSTRSVVLPLDSSKTKSIKLFPSLTKKNKEMVMGTCIVCFEEYVVGDVIVWSENKNCNHIYHKDCLVGFLARNAQRKKKSSLNVENNPCPTCRQNYVTVKEDDLNQMLEKKKRLEESIQNVDMKNDPLAIAKKKWLSDFYMEHNSEYIGRVDDIIINHWGDEDELSEKLFDKYGVRPPPVPTAADVAAVAEQPPPESAPPLSGQQEDIVRSACSFLPSVREEEFNNDDTATSSSQDEESSNVANSTTITTSQPAFTTTTSGNGWDPVSAL